MNCDTANPLQTRLPAAGTGAAVLDADEFALFAKVGRMRQLKRGEQVFRRGELGTAMYVVTQGAIDLDFGDDLVAQAPGPA